MKVLSLFFLATIIATCQGIPHQIHLLRPHAGSSGHRIPGIDCLSWRLAVETNNIREWDLVPLACETMLDTTCLAANIVGIVKLPLILRTTMPRVSTSPKTAGVFGSLTLMRLHSLICLIMLNLIMHLGK
jgi:hypothetical protein